MWNSVPDDIKNTDSFNRFKKGLKCSYDQIFTS